MGQLSAIIYAAKSTADEFGSIPTQIADCESAITREGGRQIIGPFRDEALSAFKGNRGQGLADARAAATAAAADFGAAELWVQHSDRLARGDGLTADHLAEVYFALRRVGVRLRSVQDDALLQPSTVGMAGEQNTGYSQRLAAAVTSGKDRQMERGERLGGPVPDGLRVVVTRDASDRVISREYVRDEARAPIIEDIFALSEAGHGDGQIAQALNRRGLRTQAKVLKADSPKTGRKAGDVIPPQPWGRRRIQDTLTNQNYAGRAVRHRGKAQEEVVPATNVQALITPERFDAIHAERAKRDRSMAGRDRARERGKLGGAPTVRYALSRLATCARCGTTMYCQTSGYKRKDLSQARKYVCGRVHAGTGTCDAPKADARAVDAAIVPHISGFFDDFASWSQTVTQAVRIERAQLEEELAKQRERAATLQRAQGPAHDRYTAALAAGEDDRAEIALDALAKIKADSRAVDSEVAATEAALGSLVTEAAPSDAMLSYWRELADSIKGRLTEATALADVNAELRVALDRVEIDTRGDGKLELRAIYRKRGSWEPATRPVLDANGMIPDDPEWEIDPDYPPTFVPDDVMFYVTPNAVSPRRADRGRLSPKAVEVLGASGNHTQL